jgi:hypothetical protein
MDLLKKIAFTSGMPLIVVDLLIYLTYGLTSKHGKKLCRTALDLLRERVPPVKVWAPLKHSINKSPSIRINKTLLSGLMNSFETRLKTNVPKDIPPLKDLPDY